MKVYQQRCLLIVLGGILFFHGLGDRDLNSSHEARAGQNAQMVLSGEDWLLPRLFDGHPELQKPPLYYWMVAILGLVFGGEVGPWAVRLPAALSALGCVLFVHFIGCHRGRPLAGFLAALVLATCLHFTWLARVGRIDMPLTLAITVAIGSFHLARTIAPVQAHQRSDWRWCLLAYTALGLGILLKGPIALVLPSLIGVSVLAVQGRHALTDALAGWRQSSVWWGLLWMLLIAAPWYVWANAETEGRLWEVFFWYHNVERGLGGSETLKAHAWWFYGPTCLIDLMPWSLTLPFVGWYWLRRQKVRLDPEACLGACWFIIVLLFLSCMSFKRADYLLPAYPGCALLLGCTGERFCNIGTRAKHVLIGSIGAAVVAVCLGWVWYTTWVVPGQEAAWPYRQIAREIRSHTDRPVIFFRAESHVLAFHVGRPLDTILEWENLAWWASRDFPVYVVMPEEEAGDWPRYLPGARLEEVMRSRDWIHGRRDHAVVVFRTCISSH